jgi:hypothetical protein
MVEWEITDWLYNYKGVVIFWKTINLILTTMRTQLFTQMPKCNATHSTGP